MFLIKNKLVLKYTFLVILSILFVKEPTFYFNFKNKSLIQVDKLRVEREERARAGASTPPPPSPPVEPFENRNVLKPVERTDDPESPENNPESNPDNEESKSGSDKNGDDAKSDENDDDKPTSNGEKTEYVEMINQRSSPSMTALSQVPGGQSYASQIAGAGPAQPGFPVPGQVMMAAPQTNGFAPAPMPPPYPGGPGLMPGKTLVCIVKKFSWNFLS